ncbi:MAG: cupredoxin domain-containing protein [Nitrospiraceae bacterium]
MAWAGAPVVLEPGADGVQRATITLDSYSYTPDHVIVQAGKPVELTLNSATLITPHNFIIKELAVEQDVGAGKTATVRFTPVEPGIYPFYCDKKLPFFPSHRAKGMEGRLEVR